MKTLLLAGIMSVSFGAACFAQQGYWVVGNRDNGKCDIVTSNPVIYGYDAYTTGYWFGSGPYQSLDDAKLARSTISACPKADPNSGN
jgi:hypothetical protein